MKTSFYPTSVLVLLVSLFSFTFASAQTSYAPTATLTSPVNYSGIADFLAANNGNTSNKSAAPANGSTEGSLDHEPGVVVSPTFGAISGPSTVCDDDMVAVTYSVSISSVNGTPVQYYWFVPADWTILSGQNTSSISVMPGNSSGQVAVFAIGYCICTYSCMPVTNECEGPVNPLPVELISFNAARSQADVLLTWSTAQEKENERFEIERSLNGRDFTRIGSVKGNGNSQSRIDYRFTDNQASASMSYYRLKQVDFNGQFEYSSVKAVKAGRLASEPVSVYPNPAAGIVNVQLASDVASDAVVTISSVTGQLVYQGTAAQLAATNQTIDMSRFQSGVYILNVNSGSENQSLRITKL